MGCSSKFLLNLTSFIIFWDFLTSVTSLSTKDSSERKLIVLLGLPLSGHHVINEGLLNLKIKSCHNEVNHHSAVLCRKWPVPSAIVGDKSIGNITWPLIPEMPVCYVGHAIQRSIANMRPPFEQILQLGFSALTQLDACKDAICIFPQYEALAQITSAYPDAYYIYTKRDTATHIRAVAAWDNLLERYDRAGYLSSFPGQSKKNTIEENGQIMLTKMQERITNFFTKPIHSQRSLKNPTRNSKPTPAVEKQRTFKYLEINVEDPKATQMLSKFLNLTGLVLEVGDDYRNIVGIPKEMNQEPVKPPMDTPPVPTKGINPAKTVPLGPGQSLVPPPAPNQPDNLIILVGLPKSGTTSIQDALRLLNVKAAHFEVNQFREKLCINYPIPEVTVGGTGGIVETVWSAANKPDGCYVGHVMQQSFAKGTRPLDSLIELGYRAFTQIDVCRGNSCLFPQIEALEEITMAYPQAYYIHTRRSTVASHVASMDAWDGMLARFKAGGYLSKFDGQTETQSNQANGAIMIEAMQKITMDYFQARPSLRFLDVCIEDENAGADLASFLHLKTFTIMKKNAGHYDKRHSAAPTPSASAALR